MALTRKQVRFAAALVVFLAWVGALAALAVVSSQKPASAASQAS